MHFGPQREVFDTALFPMPVHHCMFCSGSVVRKLGLLVITGPCSSRSLTAATRNQILTVNFVTLTFFFFFAILMCGRGSEMMATINLAVRDTSR